MNNNKLLYKQPEESITDYIGRVCTLKDQGQIKMSWIDICDWLNMQLGYKYSESWYRKGYRNGDFGVSFISGSISSTEVSLNQLMMEDDINAPEVESVTTSAVSEKVCNGDCDNCDEFEDCVQGYEQYLTDKESEINEKLQEMRKERIKISDERVQNNAFLRRLSREETLKEIAFDYAEKMNKELRLPLFEYPNWKHISNGDLREGILLLSDWHYGFDFENPKNKFNASICRARVNALVHSTVTKIREYNLNKLHVLNLSDLIAGRIHLTIRLSSREDTITQIMEVSEILAEALHQLSQYCKIDYHQVNDNHSRIEPNKTDSLELETLCRITPWYLKSRLNDNSNIIIYEKEYSHDIALFNVLGHKIAAVHGDKDKPEKIVTNLSRLTGQHFQLICAAHNHHFSATEENDTLVVFNGSLMGTDDYAFSLRLHSTPSQTLIIVSPLNITEAICRIPLK